MYGPVSIPLTGLSVSDCAYFHQSTVTGCSRPIGPVAVFGALTEAGIEHVFYESPGTDHEWQTWRRNLNDFAPRLFQ